MNISCIAYPLNMKGKLNGKQGVYLLVSNKKVLYIGKSIDVGKRLHNHHVFDPDLHDEIWLIEESNENIVRKLEDWLIRTFQPLQNKAGKK